MNVYLLLKNVVSYFNSTSNHNAKVLAAGNITLFLISILHQTTTIKGIIAADVSCFLFQFYIKPQQSFDSVGLFRVVSYFNSTSNHNSADAEGPADGVVSYFNSTSNHNLGYAIC